MEKKRKFWSKNTVLGENLPIVDQNIKQEESVSFVPKIYETYPGLGYYWSPQYKAWLSQSDYLKSRNLDPEVWPSKTYQSGYVWNYILNGYLPPENVPYTPPAPKLDPNAQAEIERLMIGMKIDFNGDIWQEKLERPKNLYLQRDGFWSIYDCDAYRLVAKDSRIKLASDVIIPGQYQILTPSFSLKTPSIPGHLFSQVLALFRHYVNEGHSGVTEVMVQFYWDNNTKEYFIECPRQQVSGGHIEYCKHEYSNYDPNCKCCKLLGEPKPEEFHNPRIEKDGVIKVLDIHSHNTMGAFFSSVDDADEKGNQFYGVIGKITATGYDNLFRMGIDGNYHTIERKDLIDESSIVEALSFPEEWLTKVHLLSAAPLQLQTYQGSTGLDDWQEQDFNDPAQQSFENLNFKTFRGRRDFSSMQSTGGMNNEPYGWLKYHARNAMMEVHHEAAMRILLSTLLENPTWRRHIVRYIKSQHE